VKEFFGKIGRKFFLFKVQMWFKYRNFKFRIRTVKDHLDCWFKGHIPLCSESEKHVAIEHSAGGGDVVYSKYCCRCGYSYWDTMK
jgi:hypothetical protein